MTIQILLVTGSSIQVDRIDPAELESNKNQWETCVVPGMLGVPLKVKSCGNRFPFQSGDNDPGIFMMVKTPTGLADPKWSRRETRAFARSDRIDFSSELFWQLYDYIYTLMDYYGDDDGARRAVRKMNPRDFAVYTKQTEDIAEQYKK